MLIIIDEHTGCEYYVYACEKMNKPPSSAHGRNKLNHHLNLKPYPAKF